MISSAIFLLLIVTNEVLSLDVKNVLIIGGTRFSGLYLWRELFDRGHKVTLFNRGKTALTPLPRESEADFNRRCQSTKFIHGNRQIPNDLAEKLGNEDFDVVYDMNGREKTDTAPLADLFLNKVEHFVYMSSAGVYEKSLLMPHAEGDREDIKSRHKGKYDTELYLKQIGIPYTIIRPTYIYGPLNYNPLEQYFFERISAKRPVCIPGHGQFITGLGHVKDLAVAMAQVVGREQAKGQIYNIQDTQSVTFEGLARICGQAMGEQVSVHFFDKKEFDFGDKKFFPMREQHFFCSVEKAMAELDWKPSFSLLEGLTDSYQKDFRIKQEAGQIKADFSCDDIVMKSV